MSILIHLWRNKIATTFLAGLVMFLPVMLTFIIIAWIANFLESALGPGSFLGTILTTGGIAIVGRDYETWAFIIGMVIALLGIFALGIAARSAAQASVERFFDRTFAKMPFIRAIYNPVSRMVRMTTDKNAGDFSGMTVVVCRFGGAHGADILALLANPEVYNIAGQRRRLVYMPTSPVPMSGGLLMVPEDAVFPVPEMKVEDLLRIYLSLGTLAPDALPKGMRGTPPEVAASELEKMAQRAQGSLPETAG